MKLEDKDKLIQMYYDGVSLYGMARGIKTSEPKIKTALVDLGISYVEARHRKGKINETAFSDFDNESCAYFYGLLLGDGCMTNRGHVVITLKSSDCEILYRLQKYLGYTSNIKTRKVKLPKSEGKYTEIIHFTFSHPSLISQLKALGMESAKSGKEKVPDVFKFNRHFWRGLIDADGCLQVKNKKGCKHAALSLVSSLETVKDFKNFCESVIDCDVAIRAHNVSDKIMYAHLSGQSARKITMELYKDCEVYLDRKWACYLKMQEDHDYLNIRRCTAQPYQLKNGMWRVQVGVGNKTVRFGRFQTKEDALIARDQFVMQLNLEKQNGTN